MTRRGFSGVLAIFHFLIGVLVIWRCSFCEKSQNYSLMICIILCIYYKENFEVDQKITGCLMEIRVSNTFVVKQRTWQVFVPGFQEGIPKTLKFSKW